MGLRYLSLRLLLIFFAGLGKLMKMKVGGRERGATQMLHPKVVGPQRVRIPASRTEFKNQGIPGDSELKKMKATQMHRQPNGDASTW